MAKITSRAKHPSISAFDTPEPDWFQNCPVKSTWTSWLINSNHYGSLIEVPPKETIKGSDFHIVVKGCVLAFAQSLDGHPKGVFVDTLGPGDLIWPLPKKDVLFSYETRSLTHLISVPRAAYLEFSNSIVYSEAVLMAAELNLMTKHARASQFLFAKDLDRVKRVITTLAGHPDAHHSARGIEVMACKEEIRTLAGVERRSGSRAFKILEEEGTVRFCGYKSFLYHPPMAVEA